MPGQSFCGGLYGKESGFVFLRTSVFLLSVSFHQCTIIIYFYASSYQKEKRAKTRMHRKEQHSRFFNHYRGKYSSLLCQGPRWPSWLRHCATNRKFAGSIPDGVIGIFHRRNPSGRYMTWGQLSL
jgi:hypothetical protein